MSSTKSNNSTSNSRRIAKNTLLLYLRMLLMMVVTLYTSRVVLAALGVEDFGIYNVVGGVVAMFTMISGSLSSAISRYITFELGKKNQERLNKIFSTSIIIQLLLSAVIMILIETVGVWFLANKMVIPAERIYAAKWVLQFSMITLIINLISIPYNAVIIAHERMSAFAYISILEALGKLAIAYFITVSPIDKLIFYAVMMSVVALGVRFTYSIYCRHHFEECRFRWVFDQELLREMFGFAGWNFVGYSSYIMRDQGGNILINMFGGGPAVNAAVGISTQVKVAITQFSSNFMVALNPQITKSYASENREYMMTLMFQGARFSFYLLLLLSAPILLNTNYVLSLWLKSVPDYAVVFVQLALIFGMSQALQETLINAILATGKLKSIQITIGIIQMMNIPISYIVLIHGMPPQSVTIVAIALSVCCLLARLFMLQREIGVSVSRFMRSVVLNTLVVSVISLPLPYFASHYLPTNFVTFIGVSVISLLSTTITIYIVGCSSDEQKLIKQKIGTVMQKFFSK